MTVCGKCRKEQATVVSRNHHYCDDCFVRFVRSKPRKQMNGPEFKAKFGKDDAKLRSEAPKLVLPLRFDESSLALLHILVCWLNWQIAMGPRAHQGFYLTVLCLNLRHDAQWIREALGKLRQAITCSADITFKVVDCDKYVSKRQISEIAVGPDFTGLFKRTDRTYNSVSSLSESISDKSLREDLLQSLEKKIILDECAQETYTHLVLPSSMSELAVQTLALTARGRGEQIGEILGGSIVTVGDKEINMLYPMRDILQSEIHTYLEIQGFAKLCEHPESSAGQSVKNKTINELVGDYFDSVEPEYPEVISTVVKAGSKMETEDLGGEICSVCGQRITGNPSAWLKGLTVNDPAPPKTEEEKEKFNLFTSESKAAEGRPSPLCYGCIAGLSNMKDPEMDWIC